MSATANSKVYLSIRLPSKMRKQLDELAERNMSTPSHEVRLAIRRHLQDERKGTA